MLYLRQILVALLLRLVLHPFVVFSLGVLSGVVYSAINPDFATQLYLNLASIVGASHLIF